MIGAITLGVLTNFLWDYLKDNFSHISNYTDIRGTWDVDVDFRTDPPRRYKERITIDYQNGKSFRGALISPNPDDSTKELTQELRGQFVKGNYAIYSFKQANATFTEFGTGILDLEDSHERAVGHSVTYGISSQVPTFARVLVTKRGASYSTADSLRLRPCTTEDLEAIMEMERLGFEPGIQEAVETFRQRLRIFPDGCFIAMSDSSIVGCVFTEIWAQYDKGSSKSHDFALDHSISKNHRAEGSVLYIVSMTVKPEFRRGGVGTALFAATIKKMKFQHPGVKEVLLLVSEDWTSARKIYREDGFIEVDRIEDFFRPMGKLPVDGIVMQRKV